MAAPHTLGLGPGALGRPVPDLEGWDSDPVGTTLFPFANHWGETGGTLGDKDKEIWVRMGKFTLTGSAWAQCGNWRVL